MIYDYSVKTRNGEDFKLSEMKGKTKTAPTWTKARDEVDDTKKEHKGAAGRVYTRSRTDKAGGQDNREGDHR